MAKDIIASVNTERESMPLQQRHVVTRSRFVLGHSHLVGKLVEQNNVSSSLKHHELCITLTTTADRPDLVPGGASSHGTAADVFGWVAQETLSQRSAALGGDIPGSAGSGSDGEGMSYGTEGDGDDDDDKDAARRRRRLRLRGPMTVSMAVADSKHRIRKIMEKSKLAAKKARRGVQKIRYKLGLDLEGISKEARRVRHGDVTNDLANELAGMSHQHQRRK